MTEEKRRSKVFRQRPAAACLPVGRVGGPEEPAETQEHWLKDKYL